MNWLLIIDGSNLLFQMFFGMPARIVNEKGKPIQGTLGFVGALLKIIRKTEPAYVEQYLMVSMKISVLLSMLTIKQTGWIIVPFRKKKILFRSCRMYMRLLISSALSIQKR